MELQIKIHSLAHEFPTAVPLRKILQVYHVIFFPLPTCVYNINIIYYVCYYTLQSKVNFKTLTWKCAMKIYKMIKRQVKKVGNSWSGLANR